MSTRRLMLMAVPPGVAPAVACREGSSGLEGPAFLRPVIHEIDSPELAAGGPDTVIVVSGEDFVTGSVVRWDNVERPTTKKTGRRELEVTETAAQIADTRQVEVRVLNGFSDAANDILGPGFPYSHTRTTVAAPCLPCVPEIHQLRRIDPGHSGDKFPAGSLSRAVLNKEDIMKRRVLFPTLTTLTVAVVACGGAAPLSDADRTAIGETHEAYRQAVLAADEDAIAAVYTTDAVEMPPNEAMAEGRDAIRMRNAQLAGVTQFELTALETEGFGDVAFERGTYAFAGMVEGMPGAITDTGKYLVVLRKQADGGWLIHRAMWNSDLPPQMPPGGDM